MASALESRVGVIESAMWSDPATFSELLRIAAAAGVIEFTAGPFVVKFNNHVAEHWRLQNRLVVDGKGRPV